MSRVLVVDDNPINLLVMEKLLKGYGLQVTSASSGREALEKIKTMEYGMVFMDHLMPEMNGIEVLHAIRSMEGEYYKKVPVIALTANELSGAREQFLEEGFFDFMQKPVKPAVLETVLKRLPSMENVLEEEQTQRAVAKEKSATQGWEQTLAAEGLDVKTALFYCNGKESYLEILRDYCRSAERTECELEAEYKRENWESYTVLVHGMKSALRSIGAVELAEEAKRLETAGRQRSSSFLTMHHRDFLTRHKKMFLRLQSNPLLGEPARDESSKNAMWEQQTKNEKALQNLSEEAFGRLVDEMEEAAYGLNTGRFSELAAELKNYQYQGVTLLELSEMLDRKIQKADYLSAVSILKQWKQRGR